MGAPLYASLLTAAADDLLAGGPTADVLAEHQDDPPASALPLRFLAALHRQVLTGRAPALARHFPNVGGTAGIGGAWTAARELLAGHTAEIAADVRRPCQTNEPGRATALLVGLLHVHATYGKPLRLLEFGASAGLGLQVDRYRIGTFGPAGPVLVADPWQGPAPVGGPYEVVERRGCDPAPLDATTDEGRLALTSSVWAEQTDRFTRLRTALAVAAAYPISVDRATAADWLVRRLAEPRPGVATVVWHSVVWQYLAATEKTAVEMALREAGRRSSAESPLVHLAYEPEPGSDPVGFEFQLRATTWPGGRQAHLAQGGAHGPPVRVR